MFRDPEVLPPSTHDFPSPLDHSTPQSARMGKSMGEHGRHPEPFTPSRTQSHGHT